MSKYIAYLAVMLLVAAASTGIVMARQYQFASDLQPAGQSNDASPPRSCPCRENGRDCHCTDNGKSCDCANECGCANGCHGAQGQSPTTK
ncbi:MAG: hypothetical protein PHU56_03725 [Candidatus Pacebacteria bacterium]|nr:hypothetical protein [Candidatus Paceibacterota bacterium]